MDGLDYSEVARDGTQAWREYVAREGVQQYRDYFEDAAEEQPFFEYLDNLSNRDQIRFMEIFKDYTIDRMENKGHILIPKREFNPEISSFSNFLLDLVDFKDRVRPMASDIARHDAAQINQRRNVNELESQMREFNEGIGEGAASQAADVAAQSVEEAGYSSLEIAAESGAEDAEPAQSSEPDAAEPDLEAAADMKSTTEAEVTEPEATEVEAEATEATEAEATEAEATEAEATEADEQDDETPKRE